MVRWLFRGIVLPLVLVLVPVALVPYDHTIKIIVESQFDCLDLSHTVVPLMTPLASYDANAETSDVTWPKQSCCTSFQASWPKKCNVAIDDAISIMCCWCWCQWHHMTKSHVVPYFEHLDIRNAMVPFMMPLASYDTSVSANGTTWPTTSWCTLFHCLDIRNAAVPVTMALVSHDMNACSNGITWEKETSCTSF